jgi:soluble lytic murein transglycosylase-like protein
MMWFLLCCQLTQNAGAGTVLISNIPRADSLVAFVPADPADAYNGWIEHYGRLYNVDPKLIRIVIDKESQFNPNAVSRSGAIGLMQLMPETAEALDVKDPYDPGQNIEGGVRFLHSLFDMFDNNLELVLAAYHAGPGLVSQLNRVPSIPATIEYVDYILSRYGAGQSHEIVVQVTEEGVPLFTNRPK